MDSFNRQGYDNQEPVSLYQMKKIEQKLHLDYFCLIQKFFLCAVTGPEETSI